MDVMGFKEVVFAFSVGYLSKAYTRERAYMKNKYKTLGDMLVGDDKVLESKEC